MSESRLQRERDLYLGLLELGHQGDVEGTLDQILKAAVDAVHAARGYLELYDEFEPNGPRRLARSWHCSAEQTAEIRAAVSTSIVSAALAAGEPLQIPFALLDERFSARDSVKTHRIEAVLCVPIGGPAARGVLYLEGIRGAGSFAPADVALAQTFARHVGPVVARLLETPVPRRSRDFTADIRATFPAERLIGRSPAVAQVLAAAARAAPLDVMVLITGPSGTGKTQLARTIHQHGRRRDRPFVELNCANFIENLFESELFGITAQAGVGITRDMPGKLDAAEGGTLFLDEVGELSATAQAKLLSVLQDKRFYAVGSNVPRQANVRIVAATNADLEALVRAKKFREDLFYRLSVFTIGMPSLDERREDLPLLAQHFADEARRTHGFGTIELSRRALAALATVEWPGNVRQLANAVERGVILAAGAGSGQVEPEHLFPARTTLEPQGHLSFHEATRRFQAKLVAEALDASDGNVTECGRRLSLSRAHVHNLIKAFDLKPDAAKAD